MRSHFLPLARSLPLKRKPIVTLYLRGDAIYPNAQGQNFAGDILDLDIHRNGLVRTHSAGMKVADHDIVHGETGCTRRQ